MGSKVKQCSECKHWKNPKYQTVERWGYGYFGICAASARGLYRTADTSCRLFKPKHTLWNKMYQKIIQNKRKSNETKSVPRR